MRDTCVRLLNCSHTSVRHAAIVYITTLCTCYQDNSQFLLDLQSMTTFENYEEIVKKLIFVKVYEIQDIIIYM